MGNQSRVLDFNLQLTLKLDIFNIGFSFHARFDAWNMPQCRRGDGFYLRYLGSPICQRL